MAYPGEGPRFVKLGGRIVYRLEDVEAFEAKQLRASTAEELALLQAEIEEALRRAKLSSDGLDSALALKYGDRLHAARQALGKDTGAIRIEDGAVTVIADLPKRVDWNQKKLAARAERQVFGLAGRLCFQWRKGQPEAFSDKTGKPDVRGASSHRKSTDRRPTRRASRHRRQGHRHGQDKSR